MAQTYYIDFSGWCEVQAENEDEAMQKFWDNEIENGTYEISSIEEKKEKE